VCLSKKNFKKGEHQQRIDVPSVAFYFLTILKLLSSKRVYCGLWEKLYDCRLGSSGLGWTSGSLRRSGSESTGARRCCHTRVRLAVVFQPNFAI